jgi:malate synthase
VQDLGTQVRRQRDPRDLHRQWFREPARRPGQARRSKRFRNIAYAALGRDGWMFDEDALGQVSSMSLDSQRNLKLAIHRDPVF